MYIFMVILISYYIERMFASAIVEEIMKCLGVDRRIKLPYDLGYKILMKNLE